jgi:hypothetical protein
MKSVNDMSVKELLVTILVVLVIVVVATQIQDARATSMRSFTLYGSLAQGWGFTSASISSPGPTIIVEQGDTVNLTLIGNDGFIHKFFVSYTNNSLPSPSDPQSSDFAGTANLQFVASNTTGTYTYYCAHHTTTMWGYLQVVPTGTIPEFQPLIMLSLLFVASTVAAALVYKRKRQA